MDEYDNKRYNKRYRIDIVTVTKALLPVMVFLSVYALIFDYLQHLEKLKNQSIHSMTVKKAQKKSLIFAIIPAVITIFLHCSLTGFVLLILCVIFKSVYTLV